MRTTHLLATALLVFSSPAFAQETSASTDAEPTAPRLIEVIISGNVSEEAPQQNPLAPTMRNFRGKLERLRKIATDPTVDGIRIKLKGSPDFAHAIDLLEGLRHVKDAGKQVVCYAETLTQRDLMFASLADLLVIPPSGILSMEGLTAELLYMKDLFAKLNVSFDVLHVGDYKTAYEDYALDTMSDAQRETIGALLDEFYGQMLSTISQNRGMSRDEVEAMFLRVLVSPKEALAAGLVDAVAFEDEFDDMVDALLGGETELEKGYGDRTAEDIEKMLDNPFAAFALLGQMLNPPKAEAPSEPHIALVYASGAIMSGKSQIGWDGTVTTMGSETIVKALEKTLEDDNCKAVVLRVNSPGGSALASDMIWRAVQRVKAKKPVVVSMGNVAASGGYWISMGASAIVAQPSTITGSMGVVSMVPNVSGALRDVGVNVEVVARGPHGDQLSVLENGVTPILRETLSRWMGEVYEDFLDKASAGRRMERSRVAELAKGRVWTGRQAEALGLVDELGGLKDAIVLACVMGGGLDPNSVPLAEYPEAPNFMSQLEDAFDQMTSVRSSLDLLAVELLDIPGAQQALMLARDVLSDTRPLSASRVQCILPWSMNIR
jgi:protease-4